MIVCPLVNLKSRFMTQEDFSTKSSLATKTLLTLTILYSVFRTGSSRA